MSWVPIDINKEEVMATEQNQTQPETTQGTRGEDVDPRTGLPTGKDYDPTKDPTFNANTAQRFEEPGRAGSDEADEANQEVT
jgi:hypothetical protein